jgi:hypothetical protein
MERISLIHHIDHMVSTPILETLASLGTKSDPIYMPIISSD